MSGRLTQLRANIDVLRSDLLPAVFEPTGNYPDSPSVGRKAAAFRVMAHAEIEAYLEDRALEVATAAWKAWKGSRKVTLPAVSLLAFAGSKMDLPPDTIEAPGVDRQKDWSNSVDVDARLEQATISYQKRIREMNHGVREANLMSLLLPVGVRPHQFDRKWLADMDSFGKMRGEVAHRSTAHARVQLDPGEELRRIDGLFIGLEKVDAQLDELLQSTQ